MNKYGLHGKLTATAGKGDQLAALLLEAAQLVARAKGCHLYLVSRVDDQPEEVWVTEVWESKADHDQSLQLESVRTLIGKAMPLLAGPPQPGQTLEVIGGAGLSLP